MNQSKYYALQEQKEEEKITTPAKVCFCLIPRNWKVSSYQKAWDTTNE